MDFIDKTRCNYKSNNTPDYILVLYYLLIELHCIILRILITKQYCLLDLKLKKVIKQLGFW